MKPSIQPQKIYISSRGDICIWGYCTSEQTDVAVIWWLLAQINFHRAATVKNIAFYAYYCHGMLIGWLFADS